MLALEILLGSQAEDVAAACLRPLGVPYDAETSAAVRECQLALTSVRPNVAINLDEPGFSVEDAKGYLRRWLLEDDVRVDRALKSLLKRRWRPYESCYSEGLALCRRFTAGDPTRFRRLLGDQVTPAVIAALAA